MSHKPSASTGRVLMIWAVILGLSTLACSSLVNQTIDKTVETTANTVGEKVGKKVGDAVAGAILTKLDPALMHLYTSSMFRVLFYHGGYYIEDLDRYEQGQFTRWKGENIEQGDSFERVLLRRRDDGTEWWRVESNGTGDDGKKVTLVMEALLSPIDNSGTRQVRRMRAKFPDEAEPREIPITEENANNWVMAGNRRLTPESLEGMTVDKGASVTVPAGTYTARHVQSKGYDGNSTLDWFLVENVPGGMVKYTNTVKDSEGKEERVWTMVLLEAGEGQTESKLGVDLDAPTPTAPDATEAEAETTPAEAQ